MIAQAGKDHRGAHGCLPTARQQKLLQACTAAPDLARTAWQQWRAGSDLQRVDSASRRLLLWVFHRREELGLTAADAAALEPHYRQVWLRNQVLLNRCAEVVGQLQASGIDCLILKGMALLTDVYGDEGGRYLEDFDLLVRSEQVSRAIAELNALGWRSPHPEELSVENSHAHGFTNAEGLSCDLHWHLLWRPHAPVDEAPLWAAKRPLRIRKAATSSLSAEHLLLHLCVHGMAWETVPPIRWMLDLHLLLQAHSIQWERVLAEASRRGVALPLIEALAIYEAVVPGAIPAWVHAELPSLRLTSEQHRAYHQLVTPPTLWATWNSLRRGWRAALDEGRIKAGWGGLIHFLCLRWHVRSARQLPPQFARRFVRRWQGGALLR